MGILSILHLPLATIRSLDKSYCHTFCPHFGWSQWNQLKPKSGWSLAPEEEERQRMEAARITEVPRIFMPKWSKCIQMQLIGLGYHAVLIVGWHGIRSSVSFLTKKSRTILSYYRADRPMSWRWNCDSGSNKRCASPQWLRLPSTMNLPHYNGRLVASMCADGNGTNTWPLGFTYKLSAFFWCLAQLIIFILQVHVRWKTYFLVTCTLLAATRTSGSEYNIVRRHCMYFSFGCFQHQSHF